MKNVCLAGPKEKDRDGTDSGGIALYILKAGIKNDPYRRWALPDRIFFGHGACHILAGVYLDHPPLPGFYAEQIVPEKGMGNHVYVTDGIIAFDYHGYSVRDRLLAHHNRVWSTQYEGWRYEIKRVDFCLFSTSELNIRNMRGPDQYLHDAVPRARAYIAQIDHHQAYKRAR